MLDRLCPVYMSWGMSWEQFWFGDCDAAPMYREAAKLREKQKDYDFWLQGLYVRDAIYASIGNVYIEKGAKPYEYPQEPYLCTSDGKEKLTEEEREDRKHRKEDGKFLAYMAEWMSAVNKDMAEKEKAKSRAKGSESDAGYGENTGN